MAVVGDLGVTNIRNVTSAHWRRWLGVECRCVVPFTSFAENEILPDGSRPPVWFAFDESRPLAFFAGLWTRWTSVRKVKEGETTNDLFAFLTTEPNAEVIKAIHPKAMPVISPRPPTSTNGLMPIPSTHRHCSGHSLDGALKIVARGDRTGACARELWPASSDSGSLQSSRLFQPRDRRVQRSLKRGKLSHIGNMRNVECPRRPHVHRHCLRHFRGLMRLAVAAIQDWRRRAHSRADGRALGSFITALRVPIASCVSSCAAAFTSATILRASIVSGRFGRPAISIWTRPCISYY